MAASPDKLKTTLNDCVTSGSMVKVIVCGETETICTGRVCTCICKSKTCSPELKPERSKIALTICGSASIKFQTERGARRVISTSFGILLFKTRLGD